MPVPTPSWAVRNGLNAEFLDADGKNPADAVTYDNGSSGLTATDVQAAIDEVAAATGSTDAADITITDAGSYFTATDVEAALQELAKKDIGYTAHGNTGSTETFDALTGWHSATLDDDCTFTFTGATSGLVASMVLELTQDGTGSRTVTWPGSVVWPGGSAPTLSTAAGATDLLMFFSRDGGTNWFGFMAGGGGGSALTVKDEGSNLDTAVTSIDFVGSWVVATNTGRAVTVTVASRSLDDLTDVVITTPAEHDTVRYDGAHFVNENTRWEPVTFNFGSGPELVWDGDDLVMEWKAY